MLGGDNVDQTLAKRLEQKSGRKLDLKQWVQLVARCRAAKESLLTGEGENESIDISGLYKPRDPREIEIMNSSDAGKHVFLSIRFDKCGAGVTECTEPDPNWFAMRMVTLMSLRQFVDYEEVDLDGNHV